MHPEPNPGTAAAGSMPTARLWGLKYALERLACTAGLVAVTPLMLVLAALVKLTSQGPVFYVAGRLGRHGRVFRLLKFRSMRQGSPAVLGPDGKVLTLKADPRVTPVGRVLRLGFDELPQLINVIKGEMCLMGPRPDVPQELERYTPRQRRRLEVLPGITGLAQVVGGRYMNNAQNYELDVLYVEHATWRMDLLILLLTLPYSFGMEQIGARVFRSYVSRVKPLGDQPTPGPTSHA